MTGGLVGRVALVTGSSRGVGRAIAVRLAADGAAVAVNYRRDREAADHVVQEIAAAGGVAVAVGASVGDPEAVASMLATVRRDLGPIGILVSNAGRASRGRGIEATPITEFESLMQVHTFGPINLVQLALPDLRPGGRSDVVMISSNTVRSAPAGAAPYTMAKAAMETFIRTLAREERSHGIRANIVAPGLVATDMGRRLVNAATSGGSIDEMDQAAPFGRVCRPEDVAGAVAFLLSADSGYVTGETLTVDGGGADVSIF